MSKEDSRTYNFNFLSFVQSLTLLLFQLLTSSDSALRKWQLQLAKLPVYFSSIFHDQSTSKKETLLLKQ